MFKKLNRATTQIWLYFRKLYFYNVFPNIVPKCFYLLGVQNKAVVLFAVMRCMITINLMSNDVILI